VGVIALALLSNVAERLLLETPGLSRVRARGVAVEDIPLKVTSCVLLKKAQLMPEHTFLSE
jgi:hypothetical protein